MSEIFVRLLQVIAGIAIGTALFFLTAVWLGFDAPWVYWAGIAVFATLLGFGWYRALSKTK
jgi:hypothetical protein